jgi:ketosteroid isomerase-like protein
LNSLVRPILFLLAVTATACVPRVPVASPEAPQVEREIQQAEHDLAMALNDLDTDRLAVLWSDRLVFTSPNGQSSTKAQRLRGVEEARRSTSGRVVSTNDDVHVIDLGGAAVAYVLSTWRGAEGGPSQQYRATHVWARENGQWRLLAAHVSKVTN